MPKLFANALRALFYTKPFYCQTFLLQSEVAMLFYLKMDKSFHHLNPCKFPMELIFENKIQKI